MGYRDDLVKVWCATKYEHDARTAGARTLSPYGARILPVRSHWNSAGDSPIDLSQGIKRTSKFAAPSPLHGLHPPEPGEGHALAIDAP